jgi:hypothetical protein
MNSRSILCIIDMQYRRRMDGDRWTTAMKAILQAINNAKDAKATIMVVESKVSENPTYQPIIDEIGKYPYMKVMKNHHDGSSEILTALENMDYSNIYICGSYTCCCVLATVRALRENFGAEIINVIEDACFPVQWEERFLREEGLRKQMSQQLD